MNDERVQFCAEAEAQLQDAEALLAHLGQHPDDAAAAGELARVIHTVKGAAQTVAAAGVAELLHLLEDIVRQRPTATAERRILHETAYETLGVLRDMLAAEAAGRPAGDPGMLLDKLRILALPSAPAEAPAVEAIPPFDPSAFGDPEMLKDFCEEADGLLGQMNSDFIVLEGDPGNRELLNGIFRVIHTLKGNSGTIGLAAMNRLAHRMENVLGDLREGTYRATPELLDPLFAGADLLTGMVGRLRQGEVVAIDCTAVLSQLAEVAAAAAGGSPGTAAEEKTAPVPAAAAGPPAVEPLNTRLSTLRVDTVKLDRAINLVGELAIAKIRLDDRIAGLFGLLREVERAMRGSNALRTAGDGEPARRDALAADFRRLQELLAEQETLTAMAVEHSGRITTELQESLMKVRMVPVGIIFNKFPRVVRDLARGCGKQVRLEIGGAETELDKTIVEEIGDPLMHAIRNCVDHGIESPADRVAAGKPEEGVIRLTAAHEGDQLVITVADDGKGVSPSAVAQAAVRKGIITGEAAAKLSAREAQELIFHPGFSTAEKVTSISGRGVGMDVVRANITKLKGTIGLESEPGSGTRLVFRLPLTLAIIQVLLVRAGSERLALPMSYVDEILSLDPAMLDRLGDRESVNLRGSAVPLVRLGPLLGLGVPATATEGAPPLVVCRCGERRIAFAIDALLGRQEVVIKTLGTLLHNARGVSGATILGDGSVILILDMPAVVQQAEETGTPAPAAAVAASAAATATGGELSVLVVDDSLTVREALSRTLSAAGYTVTTAENGQEALALARQCEFALILSDLVMPVMDGYAFAQAVRKLPQHEHTPLVIITSLDRKIDKLRGLEAGADEYLNKPVDSAQLLELASRLCAAGGRT